MRRELQGRADLSPARVKMGGGSGRGHVARCSGDLRDPPVSVGVASVVAGPATTRGAVR